MTHAAVSFENVFKKFRRGERHDSLRDLIPALLGRSLKRQRPSELEGGEFWALRDVSFTVKPGQALGIIGPNGAGKSTTLKLLTKILRPTLGVSTVRGRLGALIEVAAGFHPDLTGRENVFLQGAIMGMTRAETLRKFDSIVEFAGISEFIDTPVKRYSSGMSARLGFSIAIHLDPDVLVVDEVLAVGDLAFQKRAFDKMHEILRRDIAVVVVSHQLERIADLCDSAILLQAGAVRMAGTPADCIGAYLASTRTVDDAHAPFAITFDTKCIEDVKPGERVSVPFVLETRDSYDSKRHFLTFRLRSAETGATVTQTGNDPFGLVPQRGTRLKGRLELTMNVGRGLYILDTYSWDEHEAAETDLGETFTIGVVTTDRHIGTAFLDPLLEVD